MRPDIIIIPNCGVNRNVIDINAAYAASYWKIPVLDLNSNDVEFDINKFPDVNKICFSTRSFAVEEKKRIEGLIKSRNPEVSFAYLDGPIDVMCCYKYEVAGDTFSVDASFGDDLLFPDYDYFSSIDFLKKAWSSGDLKYSIMTSLGCPFSCKFCMAGRRGWTPRSGENCAEEIENAVSKWGIRSFQILDDCFNLKTDRLLAFCKQIKPLKIKWSCSNGLRADCFTEEQADALKGAGCEHISFGVESKSDELLKYINKGESFSQIEQAIDIAINAGINVAGFFLIGLPGSSYEIDMDTLMWAKRKGIGTHFSYFVPEEFWNSGNKQFWGERSSPLSDAYDKKLQEKVYTSAWKKSSSFSSLIKRVKDIF